MLPSMTRSKIQMWQLSHMPPKLHFIKYNDIFLLLNLNGRTIKSGEKNLWHFNNEI